MSNVAERLNTYYPFDPSIVDAVSAATEQFHDYGFLKLVKELNIPEPFVFTAPNGGTVSLVDINPKDGYDDTIVYHDAIISPANPNMIMKVALLSAIRPNARIIALGTPGKIGSGAGKLVTKELKQVWEGDHRPTVEPSLTYLRQQRRQQKVVEKAVHVGYSLGADKVVAAAKYAEKYDHQVTKFISMDPASIKKRSLGRLGWQFSQTDKQLEHYLKASDSLALTEARKLSRMPLQLVGLLRPTSIAIAHALSLGDYEARVTDVMNQDPEILARIMWGSNSELATDELMIQATGHLYDHFGDRVQPTRFDGQYHAMCEDITLHTATILHGLIH